MTYLLRNPMQLLVPLIWLAATLGVGYTVKRVLFRFLDRRALKMQSHAGIAMIQALRRPFMLWILILAIHLAIQNSDLPVRATAAASRTLGVLWIVSLTLMFAGLAGSLIKYYGAGIPGALPVTTLTQNLAQLAVVILGLLVLLNQLHIEITPILTALGVGGLAVALALQDTLSNLFAGFYVAVAGQIRLGDYIKLNTGEEGFVTDIGWRSTTVRALSNNMIIVPNAKLAQAIVTNYHLPDTRVSLEVRVGVSYDSDPDRVEQILLDVVRGAIADVPGMLAEPAPSVRFEPGFGDSALGFTVNCHVAQFVDQFLARHELRKRIFKRLVAEGIEIPFPTRTVYVARRGAGDGSQESGARSPRS